MLTWTNIVVFTMFFPLFMSNVFVLSVLWPNVLFVIKEVNCPLHFLSLINWHIMHKNSVIYLSHFSPFLERAVYWCLRVSIYWELFLKIEKSINMYNLLTPDTFCTLFLLIKGSHFKRVLFPLKERNFNEIIFFLVICICALARVNFIWNNLINDAISEISWNFYGCHLFKMDILQYWWILGEIWNWYLVKFKKKCFDLYLLNGEFAS